MAFAKHKTLYHEYVLQVVFGWFVFLFLFFYAKLLFVNGLSCKLMDDSIYGKENKNESMFSIWLLTKIWVLRRAFYFLLEKQNWWIPLFQGFWSLGLTLYRLVDKGGDSFYVVILRANQGPKYFILLMQPVSKAFKYQIQNLKKLIITICNGSKLAKSQPKKQTIWTYPSDGTCIGLVQSVFWGVGFWYFV